MSKYLVAATLLACTTAYAERPDEPIQYQINVNPIPWDVIGVYDADLTNGIKFIKPAKECIRETGEGPADDYLQQLIMCHQKRMGWLKI